MALTNEDFPNFTDSELLRLSNGMRGVALRSGIRFGGADRKTFATRNELIAHCQDFNHAIRLFLDGPSKSEYEASIAPGLRRLRAHPNAEAIRQATLADNTRARASVQQELKMSETEGATAPATEGKKKRKVKAPAAKGAKKVAKKAAAKAPKKTAAPKGERAPRTAADADKVITVKKNENALREGTTQHERRALILKHGGKTVGKFVAAGGDRTALNRAITDGIITVK